MSVVGIMVDECMNVSPQSPSSVQCSVSVLVFLDSSHCAVDTHTDRHTGPSIIANLLRFSPPQPLSSPPSSVGRLAYYHDPLGSIKDAELDGMNECVSGTIDRPSPTSFVLVH